MNRIHRVLVTVVFLLSSSGVAFAQEPMPPWLLPEPLPPSLTPWATELVLKSYRVDVEIEGQIAITYIEQVFRNDGNEIAEATYLFPLPKGAVVSDFLLWIDGQAVEGQLLDRETARSIYEGIVRQQLDPALLEFVGRDMIQARIFPVPPGGERKIELTYKHILTMDEGLVGYRLPLRLPAGQTKPIEQLTVNLHLRNDQPLRALYSPTHPVDVERVGEGEALIGFEDSNHLPNLDFEFFYSIAQDDVDLHLLTYRPTGEDGYFLLLVTPKVEVNEDETVARDVVLVLDTSGSMKGQKIVQAKRALAIILEQLGPDDRFNVIAFSTGVRSFAAELQPVEEQQSAQRFVSSLRATGSTDIHRALLEAMALFDDDRDHARPAVVIFLTDGLPTVGVTDVDRILSNVADAAPESVRLFPFGVGYDVNTLLLDGLGQEHRGVSAYVEPGQSIDEVVSGLYDEVSTPVLSDLDLDFGKIVVEDAYPYPLPDLFAGKQLVLIGRYRDGGETDVTLSGWTNGDKRTFVYESLRFTAKGGDPLIAQLWARRKIGYLLTQVRLSGQDPEVIQEIVDLSVRYGIVTPYTSYLVQEPGLALTREGRSRIVEEEMLAPAAPTPAMGEKAVEASEAQEALRSTDTIYSGSGGGSRVVTERDSEDDAAPDQWVRHVLDKTFIWQNGIWTDTTYDSDEMEPIQVVFASRSYFDLLGEKPELAPFFALGQEVIVVMDKIAYEVIVE